VDKRYSVKFGLRTKLIVISVLFTVMMTLLVSISIYQVVNRALFNELKSKVLATVKIGADSIDRARLARLAAQARPDMSSEQTARLEASGDYRVVYDQLNKIRDTDVKVIRYVYTFVPTEDPNTTLFAVDADVLTLLESKAKGEKVADDEISHIGSTFDVSQFEKARAAIKDKVPTLDDKYVYDSVYKVNSISGYAPIFDGKGSLIAVLGMDMADINARAALADVTRLSFLVAAAAVILGLLASLFMGTYMTRDVLALRTTVVRFGEGDFSARSAIRSRDEVGTLARSFNDMIQTITDYQGKLVAAEREKAEAELRSKVESARNAENRKYLDNISQGLLMIDENHRISEQYSASLVRLFKYPGSPAGCNFVDFVYPDAEKNAAERAELAPFLDLLIGNTTADPDMLETINPFKDRELRAYDGSRIVVDARFLRISRESLVENIMVIFEDKSGIRAAEQKLAEERERYDAELEAIAAILKNGPLLFRDFIAEGDALAAELSASLGNLGDPERSAYFMRQFHSFKGSARSLQLAQLAKSAHRIEDLLLAARDSGALGADQLQAVGKSLESMKEGIRNIRESIERFSAFKGGEDSSPQRELQASVSSFAEMVGQLGRELGKEVVFEPVVKVAELPFLRELKNPIIHLLRNSMDHGIEDVYERTASGKPSAGKIRLEIGKEGSEIRVVVQDDGRGIDFARIRQKAIEKGYLPADSAAPNEELVKVLFLPGFTGKDGVSEISGRGVGLDVVHHAVVQLGGAVTVRTTQGAGTAFLLAIPLKRAGDARAAR
jgi:methyl-accepting chemotaxis protein/HPt (histidine-containing phosphotransfer) domain-containing protein